MPITYKIVNRKNPRDRTAPGKYYLSAKASGHSDLRRIATRISEMSSLSTSDTMAVLENLLHVIPQELADGRIVELGDFGSLRLILNSSGVEDSKDASTQNILRARANFTPGKLFRKMLATMDYEKEAPPETPTP